MSREWLANGDAVPPAIAPFISGQITRKPERSVEVEDAYASRKEFLLYAREQKLNDASLEIIASEICEGGDPGFDYWPKRYRAPSRRSGASSPR